MKKWCNKVPYLIFIIGIIMDISVNVTGKYLVLVTESYIDCIFAAIVTVSILCFSYVALISSFLERVYLGYKLRDIIQFKNSPINIKNYISVSLLTIFIGVLLFFCDFKISCANSLTALLIALIWVEGYVLITIYYMMTNEKQLIKLVKDNFSASISDSQIDIETFCMHVDSIITALIDYINKNDANGKNVSCDMLAEIGAQIQKIKDKNINDYWKCYNYLNDKVRECVDDFARVFGYNEMLNSIIKIYTKMGDFKHDRIDLYIIALRNMRFWNDQQLLENNYFDQIRSIDLLEIYKNKQITCDEIERITFEYYNNIMHNCICTKNVREQLVEIYMNELFQFYWKTNSDEIDPDISSLLKILKYYVLKNNDKGEREYVFQVILRQLFYNNIHFGQDRYYDFLSLFYQAFYAYTICEVETLTDDYRRDLLNTFKMEFSSESFVKISASLLLENNIEEILLASMKRIVHNQDILGARLENDPLYSRAKFVLWTPEFNVEYMFMLYLIFYFDVEYNNLYSELLNCADEKEMYVLKQMQDKFDYNTGLLNESFFNECIEYADNIGRRKWDIEKKTQKEILELISKKYAELKEASLGESQTSPLIIDNNDVKKEIDDVMKKNQILGWMPKNLEIKSVKECIMPNYISRKEDIDTRNIAYKIQNGIMEAFRHYIKLNSEELILSFDLEGIEKLKSLIEQNLYTARNYTFTQDWALREYRDKDKFKELEKIQGSVEDVSTPQIRKNLFFVKDRFKFNAEITSANCEPMNEKECADYLEYVKCYNGLYNVDGALMSKEKAMKCVEQIYVKEKYSFNLNIGFNKNDVIHINFKR